MSGSRQNRGLHAQSLLVGTLLALGLTSCVNQVAFDQESQRRAAASIPASMMIWQGQRVGRSAPSQYPSGRSFRLGSRHPGFVASCVSITTDGYCLTAAHCVRGQEGLTLVRPGQRPVAARVVWQGQGKCDLALIHAPIRALATPLDTPAIAVGMPVLATGASPFRQAISPRELTGGLPSGGRIQRINEWASLDGMRYRAIDHTAVITSGDSGGPVFDPRGALVGITVRGSSAYPVMGLRMERQYSTALQPEPGFIQSLVLGDRRRRR